MTSFTQKMRIGITFCRLYRRHSSVRWYSDKLLMPFAPSNYREATQILNLF